MREKAKAIDVIVRFLARRDYSEWELVQRLQEREYSEEEIAEAMAEAHERRWILPPEELSKKMAKNLHAKGKSHRYIANFLANKKLPMVEKDSIEEINKARAIVQKKFHWEKPFSYEQKKKVLQYLRNRTYDEASIRTVINEVE